MKLIRLKTINHFRNGYGLELKFESSEWKYIITVKSEGDGRFNLSQVHLNYLKPELSHYPSTVIYTDNDILNLIDLFPFDFTDYVPDIEPKINLRK